MKLKRYIWLLTGMMLLLASIPIFVSASPTLQEGQNLLNNPGFEEGWHWQGDSFLGKVPDGWVAWWVDDATGKDPKNPSFWKNQRPEYGLIGLQYQIADQIHGGRQSLQYGKRFATHTAGVYQQVSGLTPGTKVRFSSWGFVYGKDPDPSKTPGFVRMKVGIDPTGGTNPFGGSVAWSGVVNPIAVGSGSAWQEMSIETVAANSTVTVFAHSSPEWPMDGALTSQWDDARLITTGQAEAPTGTAQPPPPTADGPPPPPAATATPRPDGSVVHTVQSGETIWGIAIQYATGSNQDPQAMLAQISTLNNNPALIYTGQELVIAVPQEGLLVSAVAPEGEGEAAPNAESGEQAAAADTGSGEQLAAPAQASGIPVASASSSTLCVSAYNDRNSDGMRNPTTEELLADAGFTLSSESGTVGSYTSDGVSEPYCFAKLVPGTYMVQLMRVGGYNTTTPEYWAVPLPAGATANVEFGHTADPNAPPSSDESQAVAQAGEVSGSPESQDATKDNSETQGESDSESKSLLSSLGEIAVGVSGIFVLLLAAAVGVAFVASRRRT